MRPPWCLHRVQAAGVWARICPFGGGIFSRPRWANVPRPERAAGNRSGCPSSVAARRRAAEGADGLRPARRFIISPDSRLRSPALEPLSSAINTHVSQKRNRVQPGSRPPPAVAPRGPMRVQAPPTPWPRWPGRDPLSRPAQHEVCRSVIINEVGMCLQHHKYTLWACHGRSSRPK